MAAGERKPFTIKAPQWNDLRGTLPGSETYARRSLDAIKYIVIHHSGLDVDSSAKAIADYHVTYNGWPGIGYHFLIHWNAVIDYVGDIATVRYNVAGRNVEVVGVCLAGNFMHRQPGPAQLDATRRLVRWLPAILPGREVRGHREIALRGHETSCPGDKWEDWKGQLT